MIIDATFWVAISFIIFIILLVYFKIPSKVKNILDENINQIKKQVEESEKLKEEAKRQLAEYEKRILGMKKMFANGKKYELDWWPDETNDADPKNSYYK